MTGGRMNSYSPFGMGFPGFIETFIKPMVSADPITMPDIPGVRS